MDGHGIAHIDKEEAIEVLVRLSDKGAIRLVDAGVTIVGRRISLRLDALRGSLLKTFLAQPLEGS